jgi:hypothetical protein
MCYFLLFGRRWLCRAAADFELEAVPPPDSAMAASASASDAGAGASSRSIPVEVLAALELLKEVDPVMAQSLSILASVDPASESGLALLDDAMDFAFSVPLPPPTLAPSARAAAASGAAESRGRVKRHTSPAKMASNAPASNASASKSATRPGPSASESAATEDLPSATTSLLTGLVTALDDGVSVDATNRHLYVVLAASAVMLGDAAVGLPQSMEALLPSTGMSKLAFAKAAAAGGLAAYLHGGFADIIPVELRGFLRAEDLFVSFGRAPPVTTEHLRRACKNKGSPTVIAWFWEAVEELSDEDRSRLLRFWTAADSGSVNNLPQSGSKPPLSLEVLSTLVEDSAPASAAASGALAARLRLPSASTCTMQLKLPRYGSKALLKRSLHFAIAHGAEQFAFL